MATRVRSSDFTQAQIDDALTALIAHAGNSGAAVRWLKAEKKVTPTAPTLLKWARILHVERYEELREKLASVRESQLANDYLDAASHAIEVTQLAVQRAEARLKANKDEDPAKSAASLARVSQSMIEKRLTLQGRPSRISETRDAEEIVRRLVAMKVIKLPDGDQAQIEAGDE